MLRTVSGSARVKVHAAATVQDSVPRRTILDGDGSGKTGQKSMVRRFSAEGRRYGLPLMNFTASTSADLDPGASRTKKSASVLAASNFPAGKVRDFTSLTLAWATSASIWEFSPSSRVRRARDSGSACGAAIASA